MADFSEQIKQSRQAGPKGRLRAADTFITPPEDEPRAPASPSPAKEPRQMLTIRVPVSMHDELRRTAFETGVSMQDQLIAAWRAQQDKK